MKHIIPKGMLGATILLSLTACGEIEGIDYLRLGHPADPQARPGQVERMSNALIPENITPKPKLEEIGTAPAASRAQPAGQGMHRGSH